MSWFSRRRCTYVRPLNAAWSPEDGEAIERKYQPQIEAWERANRCVEADFDADQYVRYRALRRVIGAELPWPTLIYVRALVEARKIDDR